MGLLDKLRGKKSPKEDTGKKPVEKKKSDSSSEEKSSNEENKIVEQQRQAHEAKTSRAAPVVSVTPLPTPSAPALAPGNQQPVQGQGADISDLWGLLDDCKDSAAKTAQSNAKTQRSDAKVQQSDAKVQRSDAKVQQSDAKVQRSEVELEKARARYKNALVRDGEKLADRVRNKQPFELS